MDLKGLFKLSPTLAIKYLKKKHNKVSWDWYDIWQEAHNKSFTVAKAMREDILQDIKEAVEKMFEGTKVAKLNTMHSVGKKKRRGRVEGMTAKTKKAIVQLTEDSKDIEIFEGL